MRKPREVWRLGEGGVLEGRDVRDAAGGLEGGVKDTGGNKDAARK